MKFSMLELFKKMLLVSMAACLCLFNTVIVSVADSNTQKEVASSSVDKDALEDHKKTAVKDSSAEGKKTGDSIPQNDNVQTEPRTEIDDDSIDTATMLYIGGGVGAAVIIAAVIGSSSGSSGTTSTDTTTDTTSDTSSGTTSYEKPVGPDLEGGTWGGYLRIKDNNHKGYQNISASISHSGKNVRIRTTSSLDYGQSFSGTITSSGYMLMYDAKTGEDWTTFKGAATTKKVDLYDYVNNLKDLDRMYLTR